MEKYYNSVTNTIKQICSLNLKLMRIYTSYCYFSTDIFKASDIYMFYYASQT